MKEENIYQISENGEILISVKAKDIKNALERMKIIVDKD